MESVSFRKQLQQWLTTIEGRLPSRIQGQSTLSEVLGYFEPNDRLALIDNDIPPPRVPFIKLYEVGMALAPSEQDVRSRSRLR